MGTSQQKLFVPAVKYMSAFVLLFETKMSAPGGKHSLAATINMIPLYTRKPEILTFNNDKMLSYRRETALQGALQFSPKVEDWNRETIFYGHYRSL